MHTHMHTRIRLSENLPVLGIANFKSPFNLTNRNCVKTNAELSHEVLRGLHLRAKPPYDLIEHLTLEGV